MEFIKGLGNILFGVLRGVILLSLCSFAGCMAFGLVGGTAKETLRATFEFYAPGGVIRVVDDNPVDVSISPDGQYMFRGYQSDAKNIGFLDNLITGETKILSDLETDNLMGTDNQWLSNSLFVSSGCIYNITYPAICAIPITEKEENGNGYSIEFIIENSEQIIASEELVRVFGISHEANSEPIAYNAECNNDCRDFLKNLDIENFTIVPYLGDGISPNEQYFSNYFSGCLSLFESSTKNQVGQICEDRFSPWARIRPLGWNATSNGYYFRLEFDDWKKSSRWSLSWGDVLLLPVP